MSRFCEQCGAKLEPNDNFCMTCGAKVIRDEPPDSSPKSKSPPTEIIYIGLGVAVLLLVTFGIFFQSSSPNRTVSRKPAPVEQSKPANITVPYVVGKSQSDAAAALKNVGLEVHVSDAYDDSVPIGKIISQSPNSGANIAKGQTVYVYVSKGVDPAKTKQPEPLTEVDLTIGGLTLGMSKSSVKTKYGNPSYEDEDYFNYGNVEVGFANDIVKTVACTGGNATARGIVIGDSLSQVERAYGTNYSRDKDGSGDIYTYNFGNSALRFVFDAQTGKLTRIAVYKSTPNPKPTPPSPAPKPANDGYNYSCTVGGTTTYKGILRNGIACALYDWHTQKQMSFDYLGSYTARGTFYVVTVIVGNGTNEPIFTPSIYLVDERGRKYSSNDNVTSSYTTDRNVEIELMLNPGTPKFDYEVFDIPDGVNITSLRCEAFTANFNAVEFNVPLRVVTE
ncbi:MAG: PASTA domain-containing protein [Selenomonadaceae bacterium]|nr:PASTA domain-containing protein [Selenomonadaceae bacterium]